MSASAAAASGGTDWLTLHDLMSEAQLLYPKDKSSKDVLYSYGTDEKAKELGQLLMDVGVVKSPRYVKQLASEHSSASALYGPKAKYVDVLNGLVAALHTFDLLKNVDQRALLEAEEGDILRSLPIGDRFGVLLENSHIDKIQSMVSSILAANSDRAWDAYQKSEKELGTVLLLECLIDQASKIETYTAGTPSGNFYACDTKEKAIQLSQTLKECGVLGGSGGPKYVAQHCLSTGDQRFGVILTDANLATIKNVTEKALTSEAASQDFVVSLPQVAKKTLLTSGEICYQFADQKMALIVSRSLFIELKIGKDAKYPKEVVQESGHFVINVTTSEDTKIGKRISMFERMTKC